jgi:hypothetical protein
MADQAQTEGRRHDSFAKQLSTAAAKKALAPLAAAAATAGTTYLMRKAEEIWEQRVLPKLREKGGGQAVVKGALEKAGERLGGSDALSGLAERVTEKARPAVKEVADKLPDKVADKLPDTGGSGSEPDAAREKERKARKQRRQQRQRALEQSGST